MQLQNNTVLITGGSSGIGLELAKQLLIMGNTVLVCGRSAEKLEQAQRTLPDLHTIMCDVADPDGRKALLNWVITYYPKCNVLVNNAAIVHRTDFRTDQDMEEKAIKEIQTNLVAPIALTKLFLPVLERNKNPAIVAVTTGLIYSPRAVYPIYSATKSGLHAFTRVLRHQLRNTPVRVTEIMMTVVNTPWHNGQAPQIAVSPAVAVEEMIRGIEKGKQEVRIGKVKLLYLLSRLAPGIAFKMINRA